MKLKIDGLTVYFPYDYVYPEQYDYMRHLKNTLDGERGHCLLEMPTGTGKTVSLLSLILSYQLQHPDVGKLVYCTRTVQEMDKVVEELRRVIKYLQGVAVEAKTATTGRKRAADGSISTAPAAAKKARNSAKTTRDAAGLSKSALQAEIEEVASGGPGGPSSTPRALANIGIESVLGVCLSSRRNMCVHPEVSQFDNRGRVDALCRQKTAQFVRERGQKEDLCSFYEEYTKSGSDVIPAGVFSIHDMMELGLKRNWCPYYMARHLLNRANVVVYNYQYMLDPKISGLVSREIEKESIVVFDEAHNIDNVCIEALSVTLNKRIVQRCQNNIKKLRAELKRVEQVDAARLSSEYQSLLSELKDDGAIGSDASGAMMAANPVISSDILREAMPGNIRRGNHFVSYLQSLVEYFRQRLAREKKVVCETPGQFLDALRVATEISEPKAMRFCYSRLNSLLKTLEVSDMEQYTPITLLTNFCTLVASYPKGFVVLMEPHDDRTPHISDPKLRLCCVDAGLAIKPVFERFRNVIITSGTLSPLDFYTKILNFTPKVAESLPMRLSRKCIMPMIVTKGSDQVPISSQFSKRKDRNCIQNYGNLMLQLAKSVPDGICCFFTSYDYMEQVVTEWDKLGIIDELMKYKLVFVETKDVDETSTALEHFKRACDCGRGGIFFSIARGKVSEGVDFNNHYGRCVIMFGIPFQYTLSLVLRVRLEYLRQNFGIPENDFITFDAIRQTAQCVGRVIRSKMDYGLMIFADSRYGRADKTKKLPKWIMQYMDEAHRNLSTEVAMTIARKFLKEMGQPRSLKDEIGVTMLSKAEIEAFDAKRKADSTAMDCTT